MFEKKPLGWWGTVGAVWMAEWSTLLFIFLFTSGAVWWFGEEVFAGKQIKENRALMERIEKNQQYMRDEMYYQEIRKIFPDKR